MARALDQHRSVSLNEALKGCQKLHPGGLAMRRGTIIGLTSFLYTPNQVPSLSDHTVAAQTASMSSPTNAQVAGHPIASE